MPAVGEFWSHCVNFLISKQADEVQHSHHARPLGGLVVLLSEGRQPLALPSSDAA